MSDPVEQSPAVLLERIAGTLRHEVGPAVEGEYPKTQAFMASVILERVARQLSLADAHNEQEASDLAALRARLDELLVGAPPAVRSSFAAVGDRITGLGRLLTALYAWDDPAASAAIEIIRPVLRRDIDRRMEVAG